jgi:hypothetical protein
MNNRLHLTKPKKELATIDKNWEDYKITEEEIKKHSWLKTLKLNLERTGDEIKINKDKTLLNVYNSWGDETIFDIETGKIVDSCLGF